jgi:ribosomal protein S1
MRITDFGAFIALAPGLEGLIHVSRLITGPPDVGTDIDVRLLEVDSDRQRLALALVSDTTAEVVDAAGTEVSGVVQDVRRNGVAIQLDDGRTGWLAEAEANLPAGTVVHQRFRRGRPITARIRSVQGNRVTLTQRSDSDMDQSWRHELSKDNSKSGGFGTMADMMSTLKLPS